MEMFEAKIFSEKMLTEKILAMSEDNFGTTILSEKKLSVNLGNLTMIITQPYKLFGVCRQSIITMSYNSVIKDFFLLPYYLINSP